MLSYKYKAVHNKHRSHSKYNEYDILFMLVYEDMDVQIVIMLNINYFFIMF